MTKEQRQDISKKIRKLLDKEVKKLYPNESSYTRLERSEDLLFDTYQELEQEFMAAVPLYGEEET